MPKKEPLRKCVVCGERKPKSDLLRAVRLPSGEVCVDKTGKLDGRGAYICRSLVCIEKAEKKNRLKAALKTKIGESFYEELKRSIEESR
ncbi:RNase P modulator RnpM [Murdochiella massiliensis]|mgnify:CR=1 FL=1|uniref:RNase P modulator RnpM n=1 Tax=Murdochiella massiliensis TaxID=1673723 RepID=UPI0008347557|nr:YlxR family protein [Murdochiella massiliensis]MBY0584328.1 YlxR family protein [Murdochiella sp. Marseille-P8839]